MYFETIFVLADFFLLYSKKFLYVLTTDRHRKCTYANQKHVVLMVYLTKGYAVSSALF